MNRPLRQGTKWAALLALAGLACSAPARLVVVSSPLAQTISLLGDTLYDLPLDGEGGPARVGRLHAAREALAGDSADLSRWIRLGRSTVEMGRFREAAGIYNQAAAIHFTDPRVYRERGEVLLRLRQLDGALGDLRKAGILAIGKGPLLEEASSDPNAREEGGELPLTSTQYQSLFLQGIAHYCKGDFPAAYPVLAEAATIALTGKDRAEAMLWLFFAMRRIGDGSGAANVLALVVPEWTGDLRTPELSMLLAFKGELPTDSIRARAQASQDAPGALYSYGVAYALMLRPERQADAELWLEQAMRGRNWSTLPYLVAEADLARLRGIKQKVIR